MNYIGKIICFKNKISLRRYLILSTMGKPCERGDERGGQLHMVLLPYSLYTLECNKTLLSSGMNA